MSEDLNMVEFLSEVWKDIQGYEGLYKVSNLGNVKSLDRTVGLCHGAVQVINGKELKKCLGENGYHRVTLSRNGNASYVHVHRLVAIHFIHRKQANFHVNHIDKDRLNNRVDNLEWLSQKDNNIHSSAKKWEVWRPDGFVDLVYNLKEYCNKNNLKAKRMYDVASGKLKHHRGFKVWKR